MSKPDQIQVYIDRIVRETLTPVREGMTLDTEVEYFKNLIRLCFENYRDEYLAVAAKRKVTTRFIKDYLEKTLGRSSFEDYCAERLSGADSAKRQK